MALLICNVRFTPESRHSLLRPACPLCAKRRHSAKLFDHLVGTREQRLRDGKAERLCGFQIDDQLVFGGRLHRQVRGVNALKNLVHILSHTTKLIVPVETIGY
jgi:hypothetical protein